MKKIRNMLIGLSFLMITACTSVPVKPWNPLRILPGFKTPDSTVPCHDDDGSGNFAWMYHLTALLAIGFACVASWLAGKFTKSSATVLIIGGLISVWALIMPALAKSIDTFAPWVIGIIIVFGVVDVGIRLYNKFKKPKEEEVQQEEE